MPPPLGEREIEKKIRELRHKVHNDVNKLPQNSIKRNISKKESISLKELKNTTNICISTTDKTNKIALVDKELFREKLNELTDNENFECLNQDPSKTIQQNLKNLLHLILPDTTIPESYWESIIPSPHAQAPNLTNFYKDHKEIFPNCKTRPVMPVKFSAIENIDLIINKILSQLNPYLNFRIFNTQAIYIINSKCPCVCLCVCVSVCMCVSHFVLMHYKDQEAEILHVGRYSYGRSQNHGFKIC